MPHICLSTSADLIENVDISDILAALCEKLSGLESINSADVKAYHVIHANWAMGKGAPHGFAHIELRLLDSRPTELLISLGETMYVEMGRHFERSVSTGEAKCTLEVRPMSAQLYWKS